MDRDQHMVLRGSRLYRLLKSGWWALDVVDAVAGFLGIGGDMVGLIVHLPYVYFAAFKARSVSLTVRLLLIMGVDFLIGVFPFLGNFVDCAFAGCYLSRKLVVEYVEGSEKVERSGRSA